MTGQEERRFASQRRLPRDLLELLQALQQQRHDPQQVLDTLVAAAVAMVPGAEHGSISLITGSITGQRSMVSAAATSDVARGFDSLQEQLGEGPCLAATYHQPIVQTPDLGTDQRWPLLSKTAPEELGVRSMLCFQLFVHEKSMLGGLNLLAVSPGAFGEQAQQLGAVFAAHAATALAGAQELAQLKQALANRDVIGQAKGILMERYKLDAQQAFSLLSRISQDRNVRLHSVAEQVASTGQL